MAGNTNNAHIASDPAVLGGKPVIAGTRISVQLILQKLADGWTVDELLNNYPQVSREQLEAAFAYAAQRMGSQTAAS